MSWSLVVREGSPTAGEEKEVDDDEVDSLISCLEREEVSYVTKLRLSTKHQKMSVFQWDKSYSVCTCLAWCVSAVIETMCLDVCVCAPLVLHTLLAATFHRLLHVLRKRGAVVAFEGEPPASHPQRSAAGAGADVWLRCRLATTLTFNPGKRFWRLAEDGATLQPVVIPDWLASTWGLCGR